MKIDPAHHGREPEAGDENRSEHGDVEQAHDSPEDALRHIALQCGDGQHIDEDHAHAGDDLEPEGDHRGVHERGRAEWQRLARDAGDDDRRQPVRGTEAVGQPGGDDATEGHAREQVPVAV